MKHFMVDVAIRGANLTEEGEFGRNVELSAMLDTVCDWLSYEDSSRTKRLMDTNGNTVGRAWFEDDEDALVRRVVGTPFMGPTDGLTTLCLDVFGGHACHRAPHEDNLHVRQADGVIVAAWVTTHTEG